MAETVLVKMTREQYAILGAATRLGQAGPVVDLHAALVSGMQWDRVDLTGAPHARYLTDDPNWSDGHEL